MARETDSVTFPRWLSMGKMAAAWQDSQQARREVITVTRNTISQVRLTAGQTLLSTRNSGMADGSAWISAVLRISAGLSSLRATGIIMSVLETNTNFSIATRPGNLRGWSLHLQTLSFTADFRPTRSISLTTTQEAIRSGYSVILTDSRSGSGPEQVCDRTYAIKFKL